MISYLLSGLDKMKTNHEETKNTKKKTENLRVLRFFVVGFRRSF